MQLGQDRSGRDAQRQRQAAETGNRPFVNAPKLVGPIDGPDPCRHPGHQRSRQHAAGHRHGEDHQVRVGDHHRPNRLPETRSVIPVGVPSSFLRWGRRYVGRPHARTGKADRRAAAGLWPAARSWKCLVRGTATACDRLREPLEFDKPDRQSTIASRTRCDEAREDCVPRALTNKMRQTTVDLVFHDSCGCVPIPRFHLRQGCSGFRSISPRPDPVKAKSVGETASTGPWRSSFRLEPRGCSRVKRRAVGARGSRARRQRSGIRAT